MTEFRGGPSGHHYSVDDDDFDWHQAVRDDYQRRQQRTTVPVNDPLTQQGMDAGKRAEAFAAQQAEYRSTDPEIDYRSALDGLGRTTAFHPEARP